MNDVTLEPNNRCALCREAVALYDCSRCARPICEPCSAAVPDWAFVCLDCYDGFGWHDLTESEDDSRGGGFEPSRAAP